MPGSVGTSSAPRSSLGFLKPKSVGGRPRELRYAVATDRLRATGHTASDQLDPCCSGSSLELAAADQARREDGIVRPLLGALAEETRAYCDERGLPYREDSSNAGTKRGLIRNEILPLLERLDPARSSCSRGR